MSQTSNKERRISGSRNVRSLDGFRVPPHTQLIQTGTAFWASQMLLVAAQLELADRLGDGPKTSDQLANELR